MRVFIVGGTGLIGKALAKSLVADNHTVIVSSRTPDKVGGMPDGVQLVKWDPAAITDMQQSVGQADAVVNLVGESLADGRWSKERKRRILDSRVLPGRLLVEMIQNAAAKPQVLIQSSAVGYYGQRGAEPVAESASPGSDFGAHVCFQWESSTAAIEKLGVRRAIIRTGIVLSTEGGALPKILLPFKFFAGGKIGSGKQYWPWIHIDDEIRAIRFLLDTPAASGPFNLTAPQPVTARDFAKTVGKVMGRPDFVPAPAFALKLALGEMSSVLLEGQRALPQKLEHFGFTFNFTTLEAALTDLLA